MKKVCVVTGGGSGMGLSAALQMPKDRIILVSGRSASKLEKAVAALQEAGFEAYFQTCDMQRREEVQALAAYAASLGTITNVIHCAGISPAMQVTPKDLIRTNALGTVYVNQEFAKYMEQGSVIVDVASMSAYSIPAFLCPKHSYPLAEQDEERFIRKMLTLPGLLKAGYEQNGLAYSLSKHFVTWYAAKSAFDLGGKGIRVVSISPGLIATDMGNLEEAHGGAMIPCSCERRMGKVEELGFAIATLADERNGYMAGIDILCDGGTIRGKKEFRRKEAG